MAPGDAAPTSSAREKSCAREKRVRAWSGEMGILRNVRKYLRWTALAPVRLVYLSREVEKLNVAVGAMLVDRQMRNLEEQIGAGSLDLGRFERRVLSQGGEDGVLQLLTRLVPIRHRVFVEFGVEDYRESNTRFLLLSGEWKGLVIDGDPAAVRAITEDPIVQRNQLAVVEQFITAESIDALIKSRIDEDDIGVLSIDVDGNDYWVWRAIRSIHPAIVIVEYNYRFGPQRARHGAVRPHVRAGPRRQAVRVLRRVVGGPRYPR